MDYHEKCNGIEMTSYNPLNKIIHQLAALHEESALHCQCVASFPLYPPNSNQLKTALLKLHSTAYTATALHC